MFRVNAEGVHSTEIDVDFKKSDRAREKILSEIRDHLGQIPGINFSVGQPISHRLDHLLSGVRAQIAIKIFGDNLEKLRLTALQVESLMKEVKGVAPGQSAVFYDGNDLVGGGIIQKSFNL